MTAVPHCLGGGRGGSGEGRARFAPIVHCTRATRLLLVVCVRNTEARKKTRSFDSSRSFGSPETLPFQNLGRFLVSTLLAKKESQALGRRPGYLLPLGPCPRL